jgi:hypothetical protein
LNEALVVMEGATDLRVLDEGLGVHYGLGVAYPAEIPLATLRSVLSDKGWTPLLKDPQPRDSDLSCPRVDSVSRWHSEPGCARAPMVW